MADSGQRTPRSHRTWFERLAITATIVAARARFLGAGPLGARSPPATIVAAVASFLAAGSLVAGYMVVRSRSVVSFTNPADVTTTTAAAPPTGPTSTGAPGQPTTPPTPTTTPETFPPADPTAQNF